LVQFSESEIVFALFPHGEHSSQNGETFFVNSGFR
jgi:hypothetical protein